MGEYSIHTSARIEKPLGSLFFLLPTRDDDDDDDEGRIKKGSRWKALVSSEF